MMTTPHPERRFAWATYASFSNNRGSGGWKIGPQQDLGPDEAQLFTSVAPTQIDPLNPVTEFLSTDEIADLPRRFAYFAPNEQHPVGLYLQSVPAGKDATGRPGNVFTVCAVDRRPESPMGEAGWPVCRYQSPDFPTPFRSPAVNSVTLDVVSEPKINQDDQINAAWSLVNGMLGDERTALYALQIALEDPGKLPVIISHSPWDAVLWMTALSTTMPPGFARKHLSFSNFERAHRLDVDEWLGRGPAVVAVPFEDQESLRDPRLEVIHPQDIQNPPEKHTLWTALTEAIFEVKEDTLALIEELQAVEAFEDFQVRVTPTGERVTFGEALLQCLQKVCDSDGIDFADDLQAKLDAIPAELRTSVAKAGPTGEFDALSEQPGFPESPTEFTAPTSNNVGANTWIAWGHTSGHTESASREARLTPVDEPHIGQTRSDNAAERQTLSSLIKPKVREPQDPNVDNGMDPSLGTKTEGSPQGFSEPRSDRGEVTETEFVERWRQICSGYHAEGSRSITATLDLLMARDGEAGIADCRFISRQQRLPFGKEEIKRLFNNFFAIALLIESRQLPMTSGGSHLSKLVSEMIPAIGQLWSECMPVGDDQPSRKAVRNRVGRLAESLYQHFIDGGANNPAQAETIVAHLGGFIAACDAKAPGDPYSPTQFFVLEHELRECHRVRQQDIREGRQLIREHRTQHPQQAH
ncbi:hypothetical protein [Corynebacterium auriscanis]